MVMLLAKLSLIIDFARTMRLIDALQRVLGHRSSGLNREVRR